MVGGHAENIPHVRALSARNNTHPQWWKDPGLRALNFRLVGLMVSTMSFGFDAALIGGLLANPRWFKDLHIFNPSLLGAVIASNAMGSIIGVWPAPFFADLIGRKWTCVGLCIMLIACCIAQAFTRTAAEFLGVRILIGLSSVSMNVAANLLVAETTHPRQRAQITSLWITFFYVGAITVAWTSFGTLDIASSWSWRTPVIVQAGWNIIQLPLLIFLCPESPRWHANKGRPEVAKQWLAKYHANGDLDDELVEIEFEEIMAAINVEKDGGSSGGWLDLVKGKANIRRLLICLFMGFGVQWTGSSIINFYLAPVLTSVGITSARGQNGINGGLQIWSFLVAGTGAYVSDKFGRRRLFLISCAGMALVMTAVTICGALYTKDGNTAAGKATVAFLFLFFAAYCLAWTPLPALYISEISTPALRAKWVSVYWTCTGLALTFNTYVNPIALEKLGWKYYIVYVAIDILFFAVVWFFIPETKGLTLEETAGLFDGKVAAATDEVNEAVRQRHAHEHEEKEASVRQVEFRTDSNSSST